MIKSPHPALDLSFMRPKPDGNGIDYWHVETTGSYSGDCERGHELALDYLAYVGKHPTAGNMTLLGCIALQIMEKQASRGMVVGFMARLNGYAMATARLIAGTEKAAEPDGVSLPDLLANYHVADQAYRKAGIDNPDEDHDDAWAAKEAAEDAVIRHPCRTLDDIRMKAQLAIDDDNVRDSIANCRIGDEDGLMIFLRSLMGPVDNQPVDNGDNGDN